MNYVMLVCSEDAPIPDDADVDGAMDIMDWIELCGESRLYGQALKDPDTAKTVRVRDGQILVSDGPYTESKEFVAGFDLLDCEDLEAAIALAAAHPVSAHRMTELRPVGSGWEFTDTTGGTLDASENGEGRRYVFMVCVNGIPETDEIEARVKREADAWHDEFSAGGRMPFAAGLVDPSMATTVRRRGGRTLLTDGPFVEAKEFLAGLCIIRCADIDEAVQIAARNPLAAFHRVEVREMFEPSDWDELEEATA